MANNHQFLSFKGIKHYNPDRGWSELNDIREIYTSPIAKTESHNQPELHQMIESDKADYHSIDAFFDPLMEDLFDMIYDGFTDELTTLWRVSVDEINLLEKYFSTRRDLIEELNLLDQKIKNSRAICIEQLNEIQNMANQQISIASMRKKISAVIRSRLLVKIQKAGV